MRVFMHPAVENELAAIYDHYAQFDPVLPDRFEARLDEQLERIEMFPDSGALLFGSYRRVLLTRFPYMAVYAVRSDRVEVLAVLNTRRDPTWIKATVTGRAD